MTTPTTTRHEMTLTEARTILANARIGVLDVADRDIHQVVADARKRVEIARMCGPTTTRQQHQRRVVVAICLAIIVVSMLSAIAMLQ